MEGWPFYALAVASSLLVGLSKGGLPMVGILAVPVLALVMPPFAAAALLLPIYIVSDMFGLWAYRRQFSKRNLAILIPAAALGIVFGWATFSVVNDRLVTGLVGALGLIYCINALIKRGNVDKKEADIARGIFWGAITGFTSFVSHTGAPPYQIYTLPQKLEKMVFAGTSTILFAVVNAMKLIPYYALGQFNTGNLQLAAKLAPVAVLGLWIGYKAVTIIPEKLFFRIVEVALFFVSVKLLYDAAGGT